MTPCEPICIDGSVTLSCPDSIQNVLSYVWLNKTTGDTVGKTQNITVSPKTTTTYLLHVTFIRKSDERIKNWNFEKGNPSRWDNVENYLEFYSKHTYVRNKGDRALWNEGLYAIGTNPRDYHENFAKIGDHTTGKGYMMIVNGAPGTNVVIWEQTIKDIIPGNQYAFVMWGRAVTAENPAVLRFSINDDGNAMDAFPLENTSGWKQFYRIWTAPVGSYSSIKLSLLNNVPERNGNDFVIDDFSFSPVEKAIGEIEVKVLPRIEVAKLANSQVCEGADKDIQAELEAGSDITAYQWYKNGVPQSSVNLLQIRNADVARDQGIYSCKVAGLCGVDSVDFYLSVRDTLKVNPLTDKKSCRNQPESWYADVRTGYNPKYSWTLPAGVSASRWPNVNTATISRSAVDPTDVGVYKCQITNMCGEKNISARLDVAADLVILQTSPDDTICEGEPVKFWIKANLDDITVRWTRPDGTSFVGDTLYIAHATFADWGTYNCTVTSNKCGTPKNTSVKLELYRKPTTLGITDKMTVCTGGSAGFNAIVDGEQLVYQWDGPNGFTSGQSNIKLTNVKDINAGIYRVAVTDVCGISQTAQTELALMKEFQHLAITPDTKVCASTALALSVIGGGSGLTYQWTKPGGLTALGATLALNNIQYPDAGTYICRVKGVCAADTVLKTGLELYRSLKVISTGGDFALCGGENITFRIDAEGEQLRYTWSKDGNTLSNNAASLIVNMSDAAKAGLYRCVVNDYCGVSDARNYNLRLKEQTRIVEKSSDKQVAEHEAVNLFVNVKGENTRFEWRKDGVQVPGGTSGRLSVSDIGVAGTYIFTCRVAGDCGQDVATIVVKVGQYIMVTANETIQLCENSSATYKLSVLPAGCPAESNFEYGWIFKGDTVSHSPVLELKTLTSAKSGTYTGYALASCGRAEVKLNVGMTELPLITGIKNNGQLTGDTIILCGEDNASITPVLAGGNIALTEWIKDGRTVSNHAALTITGAQQERDYGDYICRVSSDCGEAVYKFAVIVRRKLKVINHQPLTQVCIGDAVEFDVTAVAYNENYVWDGPGRGWNSPRVNVYRKEAVGIADAGTYRCIINSSCGKDTVYSVLEVEKELVLTDVAPDRKECNGTQVEMYVNQNGGAVAYKWILPDGTTRISRTFTVQATAANAGTYHYEVTGKCKSKSGDIRLEVYRDLGSLTLSGTSVVCENSTATFNASILGDNLTYRWLGPNRFTASASSFTINNVTAAQAGKYELTVTDGCNHRVQGAVTLSLLKDMEGLVLNTADTTVCPGTPFVFEVKGGGAGLTYQWMHKGTVVGSGRKLILNAVSALNAGDYTCEIIGACKTVQLHAKLALHKYLVASAPETLLRECPGMNIQLLAQAEGVDVQYRWIKNGKEVGFRAPDYRIHDLVFSDAGMYQCDVTSVCGDTTLAYEVQLKQNTRIISASPDKFVCEYDPTRLSVKATGENNHYRWWCDSTLLTETTESLYVPSVGTTDTLIYTCAVWGDCGMDTTRILIKVGAFKPMKGGTDTLCKGSSYTYNMEVIPLLCYGNERFQYRWFRVGGDTLSRESILRFEDVSESDEGQYGCHIQEECGDTTVYLNIKVMSGPQILSVPQDTFVVEGSRYQISVVASGQKLSYKWWRDQVELKNKMASVFLNPVSYEDAGMYRVLVENQCGHAEAKTKLGVWEITTIVSPLEQDTAVCAGDSIRFKVEAWGEVGLVYRWYHNGGLLSVPYVSELLLTGITAGQAGVYTCVVSGRGGDDSCKINLTVNPLPVIDIAGDEEMCLNDRTREYQGRADDSRVDWLWSVTGGLLSGDHDRQKIIVSWDGSSENILGLTVTALNTGCRNYTEQAVRFRPLPDLNLDAPALAGYCLDSLLLDFAYPSGGYYLAGGVKTDYLDLNDKDAVYPVAYYYTDSVTLCSSFVEKEIGIAAEPFIKIGEDSLVTGGCRPFNLPVEMHSEGTVKWTPSVWLNADTLVNPLFTPGESQGYTVELTDQYGCRANDRTYVQVIEAPVVYAMSDTVIGECNGISLTVMYYSAYFNNMRWEPSDQLRMNPDYSAEVLKKKVGQNLYMAIVSDRFGCEVSDTVRVVVKETQSIEDKTLCITDEPLVVDCRPFREFVWNDEYADSVRTLDVSGDYRLELTDGYGCMSDASFEVHPVPVIALRDTFVFEGETYEFELNSDPKYGPYHITWHNGSGSTWFSTAEEGTMHVKVVDNNGCMASDTAFLEVRKRAIAAPDAFTPGSGGENAKFYLKEVNFVGRFEMFVYDRWGELVFKTDEIGINGGWDGAFKGMDCQGGAYVWVAFADGKIVGRGTVILVK